MRHISLHFLEKSEHMKKIGIVLSGGLAKGAYQIGVLKAVEELVSRDAITMISASSVGALNAYAFMNGQLGEAESIWREMNFKTTTSFIRNVLHGPFLDECLGKIPLTDKFYSTEFYVTLLNTTQRKVDYINLQNLSPELCKRFARASVALPPFNKPMQVLNHSYFDGAIVDNIPISPFIGKNVDCIICIYFDDYNYKFENEDIDGKTIKINQQSDMFMKNVFLFKHEYIEKMIEDGYQYGKSVLSRFFTDGKLSLSYLNDIKEFNDDNEHKKWYITCEAVTKNLNKVTKKFLNGERKIDG